MKYNTLSKCREEEESMRQEKEKLREQKWPAGHPTDREKKYNDATDASDAGRKEKPEEKREETDS